MKNTIYCRIIVLLICTNCFFSTSFGYSVLSHEAIVDASWDGAILPLLVEKYPGSTDSQLTEARAYAYGGCLASDMGYYPRDVRLFSDLLHYVRTGDFTNALLHEAQNLDEYAFALGMLCHYNADKYGHNMGVNPSVPLVFGKDKEKYGSYVTYEQDPIAHLRTEFGFDILQTARGNYVSEKYHAFIGFKISKPVLERAFQKTYGISIDDLFKDFSRSTGTFRWIIKNFFPTITRAAWAEKKAQIKKTNPTITRRNFEYKMRKVNYYHEYGTAREKPGFFPGVIAAVIYVLPKVGPLKDLKLKIPGAEAEKNFIRSFDTVLVHYKTSTTLLHKGNYQIPDIDYDTGNETFPGEYDLADKSYITLVLKIKENHFKYTNTGLKKNILKYYSNCNEHMAALAGVDTWKQVNIALDSLRLYKPE